MCIALPPIEMTCKYATQFVAWQVWLQDFAWTEKDHKRKMAERHSHCNHSSKFRDAPMFCFGKEIGAYQCRAQVVLYALT